MCNLQRILRTPYGAEVHGWISTTCSALKSMGFDGNADTVCHVQLECIFFVDCLIKNGTGGVDDDDDDDRNVEMLHCIRKTSAREQSLLANSMLPVEFRCMQIAYG